jgi:hypothetical protein
LELHLVDPARLADVHGCARIGEKDRAVAPIAGDLLVGSQNLSLLVFELLGRYRLSTSQIR